jgi:hypothetical protein
MILEKYLNIVWYKALEKETTKIIREIWSKERPKKKVRRVYNLVNVVKKVVHWEQAKFIST